MPGLNMITGKGPIIQAARDAFSERSPFGDPGNPFISKDDTLKQNVTTVFGFAEGMAIGEFPATNFLGFTLMFLEVIETGWRGLPTAQDTSSQQLASTLPTLAEVIPNMRHFSSGRFSSESST